MHTATSLNAGHFSIEIEGRPALREALFAGRPHERFGIVVHSPLGAIGASLLIELAVTAFYDCPGRQRRTQPLYPEIYAFHVGGRYGNLAPMDFWPPRKEIFLADDPADVLESVNSHAITHLAVPDCLAGQAEHRFKEVPAALDRLERCFIYAASGRIPGGDIAIRALHESLWTDVDFIVDRDSPDKTDVSDYLSPEDPIRERSSLDYLRRLRARRDEVSPEDRTRAAARREQLREGATILETYRSATPAEAIQRLGRPSAERES